MSTEAELLANLPADGVRVWRSVTDSTWIRAVLPDGTHWFTRHGDPWFECPACVRISLDPQSDPDWTEITPTPALPDPCGDLPDGTRVRVTYEGTTKGWRNSRGQVEGRGSDVDYTGGGSVEVLALPTPRPSALDGKPGSLWRDPETGGIYCRTDTGRANSNEPAFSLTGGHSWVRSASWLHTDHGRATEVIARLVPAQVADDE